MRQWGVNNLPKVVAPRGLVICELRTANRRTGNMRTNSANYGREPRVQCEPESANFLCN